MTKTLADRVQGFLDQLGWTPRGLSLRAGLSSEAVRHILAGRSQHPRHDTVEKIARALGVEPSELLDDPPPGAATPQQPDWRTAADERAALDRRRPRRPRAADRDAAPFDDARTEGAAGLRDIPSYASAEGGPSGMLVSWEPIEYAGRPDPLLNVRGGFGVYLVGDSMAPAYRHGDRLLIHPSKFPRRDDDVLLVRQIDGEAATLVKHLLGWDAETWRLEQYNPPQQFTLPREEWRQALVIVGKYNRS